MAKSKTKSSKTAESKAAVPGAEKKIDPTLASIFASSLGAVKAPERKPEPARPKLTEKPAASDDEDDDEELSEPASDAELEDDDEEEEEEDEASDAEDTAAVDSAKNRKRKRNAENEDLEGKYFAKLAEDDAAAAERKTKKTKAEGEQEEGDAASDDSDSGEDEEKKPASDFPILHESLVDQAAEKRKAELEKAARTVFLGNVPSNTISSKADYKTFKNFFAQAGKIKSVRFRSVAFSEQIPRKAAFVNHKLHEKQKTVNAYIVYKEEASARAALKFNGQVVLGRHIRVDSVAHPAKQDPRRCVFVGNLDFEAQEESLWNHFGQCGKIEYVRVVRDAKTNVGKGFAYVQFEDAMSVDPALLLDGVKMAGDRKLRVTRAKAIKRKDANAKKNERERKPAPKATNIYVPKLDAKEQANLGRAKKLLGKAGAAQMKPGAIAFEGVRASAGDDAGIKKGGTGKKKGAKPRARARSVAWKKGQVKPKAKKD